MNRLTTINHHQLVENANRLSYEAVQFLDLWFRGQRSFSLVLSQYGPDAIPQIATRSGSLSLPHSLQNLLLLKSTEECIPRVLTSINKVHSNNLEDSFEWYAMLLHGLALTSQQILCYCFVDFFVVPYSVSRNFQSLIMWLRRSRNASHCSWKSVLMFWRPCAYQGHSHLTGKTLSRQLRNNFQTR